MSFLNSSSGAGLKDFLKGPVSIGSFIHAMLSWYSDPGPMSWGVAMDLVPRSSRLQFPTSHSYSSSMLLFTLTSLTLAPTNSVNLPDSVLSIPRTADESVKYRFFRNHGASSLPPPNFSAVSLTAAMAIHPAGLSP